MRKKEQYCRKVANDFLRKLYEVLDSLYQSEQLNKMIAELLLFFNRRITECYFLSQVMIEQKGSAVLDPYGDPKHKFTYFSELLLSFQNISNFVNSDFTASFTDIVKYFTSINVPKIFIEHKNHFAEL